MAKPRHAIPLAGVADKAHCDPLRGAGESYMNTAKPLRCFVLMPSGNHKEYTEGPDEADFVYNEIIRPSVREALGDDGHIEREVDNNKPGAITTNIIKNLAKADIVIVYNRS
jgi:hypothetical protein